MSKNLKRIRHYIKSAKRRATSKPLGNINSPIINFDKYLNNPLVGRALLSYLPAPVRQELAGHDEIMFSNRGIARMLPRALNELGYVVDIISWDDKDFKPTEKYDLVIFHGSKNFEQINARLINNPKMIYFGSGSYWTFSNKAEDERLNNLAKRRGVKLPRDRYVYDSETTINQKADGIIVLGDPSMKDTFPKKINHILTINNAAYPDNHFDGINKDYGRLKNNFLFFAGDGNVHKGLDLVLESFRELDQHLYIMTNLSAEFREVYTDILQQSNVHLIGAVPMRTKLFYEVFDQCAYVILPSCSEGQAGSVVEAINQGLIPIISKETRMDVKDFGVILKNNSINQIKNTVKEMANLKTETVLRMARHSRQAAVTEYSPEAFLNNIKFCFSKIINQEVGSGN